MTARTLGFTFAGQEISPETAFNYLAMFAAAAFVYLLLTANGKQT